MDALLMPAQLEKAGFAIIPEVLPTATVDAILFQIQAAIIKRANHSSYAIRHLLEAVPAVRQISTSAAVRSIVEPVLGTKAFVARSLFFDKTPGANWKVAWHQDVTISVQEKIDLPGFTAWSLKDGIVHVQPPTVVLERMVTVRLHLDDCDASNGPLQVIPGSHKSGRLNAAQISEWRRREQPVICPAPRGGALLMHPLLLHASSPAAEPRHRRVVHLEFTAEPLTGGLCWAKP